MSIFDRCNLSFSHGQDILLLERRELLRILYDQLPDKSLIRGDETIQGGPGGGDGLIDTYVP